MTQYLIVFFISMVPLIELRGAIPYAVGFHLPLLPSYVIAIIGNMIPVPIIYLFARRVLIWGKDKLLTAYAGTDGNPVKIMTGFVQIDRIVLFGS